MEVKDFGVTQAQMPAIAPMALYAKEWPKCVGKVSINRTSPISERQREYFDIPKGDINVSLAIEGQANSIALRLSELRGFSPDNSIFVINDNGMVGLISGLTVSVEPKKLTFTLPSEEKKEEIKKEEPKTPAFGRQ